MAEQSAATVTAEKVKAEEKVVGMAVEEEKAKRPTRSCVEKKKRQQPKEDADDDDDDDDAHAAAAEDGASEEPAEEEKKAKKTRGKGKSKAAPKEKKEKAPRKKKAKKEDDEDEGDEETASGEAVTPPGPGNAPRPEDCDAYWADGDTATVEDPKDMNFAWPPKENPNQLKIVSWNVAGFRSVIKKGFLEYVEKEQPDVLCLQETKVAESDVKPEMIPRGYEVILFPCENPGHHGTAIFTKTKPISVAKGLGVPKLDKEGRLITAEYEGFYVLCAYVPNSSRGLVHWPLRNEWDVAFLKYITALDAKKPVIWCGDLNVSRLWIDLANPKANLNRTAGFLYGERDNFNQLLEAGFVDAYRHFFPKTKKFFTFWGYMGNQRSKDIGWRLDYFIVSKRYMDAIKQIWRRPKVMGSDHCPLCILVDTTPK